MLLHEHEHEYEHTHTSTSTNTHIQTKGAVRWQEEIKRRQADKVKWNEGFTLLTRQLFCAANKASKTNNK